VGGVYPRACGGAVSRVTTRWPDGGLSPRVRGSQLCLTSHCETSGSIPARAGEP